MFDLSYDLFNAFSFGAGDMIQGAINPDENFSKEHWLNSMGLAGMGLGARVPAGRAGSGTKATVNKVDGIKKAPGVTPKPKPEAGKMTIPTIQTLTGKLNWFKAHLLELRVVQDNTGGQHYVFSKRGDGSGKSKQSDYFIGSLKGEKIHLKDVKVEEIIYTKRLPEETAKLRKQFNSSIRKNFLKEFAKDPVRIKYLKDAGLDEGDIARMKDGLNPKGWQVHHNLPLDDGGTNNFTNLVLIKNDSYHKAVTNEQNSLTRGLVPKQSNWPMFEGDVYPKTPLQRKEE